MQRNVNSIIGYTVVATDGEAGTVADLCFDDKTWSTAYLVVSVGDPVSKRKVILPPTALGKPDWERKEFPVAYSKDQVERSPNLDLATLSSARRLYDGWAPLLMPDPEVGLSIVVLADRGESREVSSGESLLEEDDPNLFCVNELTGYRIHAIDGMIGYVDDVIVDDSAWKISHIVVDTAHWLLGRRVLLQPQTVNRISRVDIQVYVDSTKDAIKHSPDYEQPMPVSPTYESRLDDYYEHRNRHYENAIRVR